MWVCVLCNWILLTCKPEVLILIFFVTSLAVGSFTYDMVPMIRSVETKSARPSFLKTVFLFNPSLVLLCALLLLPSSFFDFFSSSARMYARSSSERSDAVEHLRSLLVERFDDPRMRSVSDIVVDK